MSTWQKLRSVLLMALLATLASVSYAATTAPSADTPLQAQDTPVDCKKKPDDPRCKNKPYLA
jgi:Spy/CpxP family protein refolding chaperone